MALSAHHHTDSDQGLGTIGLAVVQALAYADIFDYPLTAGEIHRYLPHLKTGRSALQKALEDRRLGELVSSEDGYYTLRGRNEVVKIRRRRAAASAELWPRALEVARAIGRMPFVRMVAITGSLAVDNAEAEDDIDFLIVTEPGRLWLARALVMGRWLSEARGHELCFNFFLSESALALPRKNLFIAREMIQMVPVAGLAVYEHMFDVNSWIREFLPNARAPPRRLPRRGEVRHSGSRLVENALRSNLGGWLERSEMTRRIRGYEKNGIGPEAAFNTQIYRDHSNRHLEKTWKRLRTRFDDLGIGHLFDEVFS